MSALATQPSKTRLPHAIVALYLMSEISYINLDAMPTGHVHKVEGVKQVRRLGYWMGGECYMSYPNYWASITARNSDACIVCRIRSRYSSMRVQCKTLEVQRARSALADLDTAWYTAALQALSKESIFPPN